MNLIHRAEDLSMRFGSGSRRAIGAFILQERQHLHEYSIQEIADRTYTSKAALARFAKELGFSGRRDFLKEFSAEQSHQDAHYMDVDPNFPFGPDSSQKDIVNMICSLQVESLLDTALTREDCAIIISCSGNNLAHTTVKILPRLEKAGVPIIALTGDRETLLREKARYTLTISSRERLYDKISTFSTKTSILYVLLLFRPEL